MTPKQLTLKGLTKPKDYVLFNSKIFVPNKNDLRSRVVASKHNPHTAGHWGRTKTQDAVQRHYN